MSTSDEDRQKTKLLMQIASGLVTLGVAAAYLWMENSQINPSANQQLKMRVTHGLQRLLDRAAHRAGYQAMGAELTSGRTDFYGLPLVLSVARDKARARYEKMRGVS